MAKQDLEILPPTEVSDLDSLAKQIDAAHVEVRRVLLTSVQLAAEVGHLLAQAKEQVPFGQWEAWIAENTAVSPRTARGYMQVSRFWAEADKAKRRALADLGLQGALAEIGKPRAIASHVVERTTEEEPRKIAARVHVEDVESEPVTGIVRVVEEEPSRSPESDRLAATMGHVREAEYESGASRLITGDSIQFTANLDGIEREWRKLDTADRNKFLSEKLRTHGHPDHIDQKIIDVAT